MSAIAVERLLTWTNRTRIGVAHHVAALIFYNINRCYGKQVAVFAVAVATGDIIKYQSFVYGSFVWGIHVRYNKIKYHQFHFLLYKHVLLWIKLATNCINQTSKAFYFPFIKENRWNWLIEQVLFCRNRYLVYLKCPLIFELRKKTWNCIMVHGQYRLVKWIKY